MKTQGLRMIKVVGVLLAIIIISGIIAFAEDPDYTLEKYSDTDYWKRQRYFQGPSVGFIYEFTNEPLQGDEWNTYGRLILGYEKNSSGDWEYKTWDWDDSNGQVRLIEYVGTYEPGQDSAPHSDVDVSKRRVSYIYDTHGEILDVDTKRNGWIERQKIIYDTNGITEIERYVRDATSKLIMEFHPVARGFHDEETYYEYVYHDRPDMLDSIRYKEVYSYTAGDEDRIISGETQGTLLASYEYLDSDCMIKREPSGNKAILSLDSQGNSHNNTYLDAATGAVDFYNWDKTSEPWSLVNVERHYTDGTIEIYVPENASDPVWPLKEKREPASSFFKGGNLPWITYGHDIGSNDITQGFSSGNNQLALINALKPFSGGAARVFLFSDLKDIVDFSGATLRFYDEDKLYRDMEALLESATLTATKIIPVLFDYWLGYGHPEVFKDEAKRTELMNLLGSFVEHFKAREEILMWDVMNEPYYGTDASPIGNQDPDNPIMSTVTTGEMSVFLSSLIDVLRTNDPGKDITIGFAKKEHLRSIAEGGYWAPLIDELDVIQIHYWAKDYGFSFDGLNFPADDALFGGKPVFIGEIDPQYFNDDPNAAERLQIIFDNGYTGGLFWQDTPNHVAGNIKITDDDLARIKEWFHGRIYTYNQLESTIYEYYEGGNLKRKIQPNGYIFEYYDALNQSGGTLLKKAIYPNIGTYEYIEEDFNGRGYGRLSKEIFPDGTFVLYGNYFAGTEQFGTKDLYDRLGNLVESLEFYANGGIKKKTESSGAIYEYDESGRMRKNTTPDGFEYSYDENGRLTSQTYPDGAYYEDIVDAPEAGKVSRYFYADNTKSVLIRIDVYTYVNDPSDYSSWRFVETIETGPGVFSITYEYYDLTHIISNKTYTDLSNGYNVTYEYDPPSRLTREVVDGQREILLIYHRSTDVVSKRLERNAANPGELFTLYEYRDDGSLKEKISYGVNETLSKYNVNGTVRYIKIEGISETTFMYDPQTGALTGKTVRDLQTGTTVVTQYHASGKIARVVNTDGIVFEYDDKGRLVKEFNAPSETIYYSYSDPLSLNFEEKRVVDDGAREFTIYVYNADGELIDLYTVSAPIDEFDNDNNLIKRTYYDGSSDSFTYFAGSQNVHAHTAVDRDGITILVETFFADGKLAQTIDRNGMVADYTYDTLGRLLRIDNSDKWGNQNVEEYNESGLLIKTTFFYPLWNSRTIEITYEYDASDRLIKVNNQDGSYEEFEYWGQTETVKIERFVDSQGRTSTAEYDDSGKNTKFTSPYGVVSTYTYDAFDRLERVDYSGGSRELYEYIGDTNRVRKITHFFGSAVNFTVEYEYFGGSDKVKARTEFYGNGFRRFEYDPLTGNLLKAETQDGGVTYYSYDSLGRITRVDYPNNTSALYTYYGATLNYDTITYIDTEGRAATYEYFDSGVIKKVISWDGREITYSYDALGRIIRADYSDNSYNEYTYDGDSTRELTRVYNYSDGTFYSYVYTYYADGVRKSTTFTARSGEITSYHYGNDRKIERIEYPDGNIAAYSYDEDRLSRIDYSQGELQYTTREYFGSGWVEKISDFFVDGTSRYDEYTYYTNANWWVVQTLRSVERDGSYILYEYDRRSRLIKVTRGSGGDVDLVEDYSYDELGRLERIDYSTGAYGTYTYYDDPFGNTGLASHVVTGGDGTSHSIFYDISGTVLKEILPDGTAVYYAVYDSLGRVVRKDYSDDRVSVIWYVGDTEKIRQVKTYTFYSSERINTTIFDVADEFGNLYYRYIDEPFYNTGGGGGGGTEYDYGRADTYGRVDRQVTATVDGDGGIAYIYEYWEGTDTVKTKYVYAEADLSDPANPVFGNLVATYKYAEDGSLIVFRDGKWHKEFDYTDILDDGQRHAQRIETYLDEALTQFVEAQRYTYYPSGNIEIKEIYDNLALTKNTSYKKFTYAADGQTITEQVSFYDGAWHKEYDFVTKDDGIHATRDDQYSAVTMAAGEYLGTFIYSFYDSGKLNTKEEYDNLALTKNTSYEKREFTDADPQVMTLRVTYFNSKWNKESNFTSVLADGKVHAQRNEIYNDVSLGSLVRVEMLEFYASGKIKKKEEFSGLTDNTWTETFWYRENGRLSQKLLATGEAAIYFNADGFKLNTYWGTNGTISHWKTIADFDTVDNYKVEWYKSGTTLEVYTYYASGRVQYKNEYTYNTSANKWEWGKAAGYLNSGGSPFGDWDDWKSRAQTGASEFYTLPVKPQRNDVGPASPEGYRAAGARTPDEPLNPEVEARLILQGELFKAFSPNPIYKIDPNLTESEEREKRGLVPFAK